MGLDLTDVGGMVAARSSNDYMGNETVTDITKSGDDLVLKYDANVQGQSFRSRCEPDGDDLDVAFDFGGQFFMEGKGTRWRFRLLPSPRAGRACRLALGAGRGRSGLVFVGGAERDAALVGGQHRLRQDRPEPPLFELIDRVGASPAR